MIISHKNKFIYLKARKVAGTSVEINLAKECGTEDVVSTLLEYSPLNDDTKYDPNGLNPGIFWNHMPPSLIRDKIGDEVWNSYKKVAIVRNPWDQVASLFWWQKSEKIRQLQESLFKQFFESIQQPLQFLRDLRIFIIEYWRYRVTKEFNQNEFAFFLIDQEHEWNNTEFYFDEKGMPFCDFYLRFESIDEDYRDLCNELHLPYEVLPKTKNRTSVRNIMLSEMYTDNMKKFVAQKCQNIIERFGYSFQK